MATPAAVLSILVEANTGKAAGSLHGMQRQLETTNQSITKVEGSSRHAKGSINQLGETAKKHSGSFKSLAGGALQMAGAFAAIEAARGAIETTTELGHATERLAALTGMDAKTASKWIEVAKVRGVQATQLSMGFGTLAKQIKAAQDGSGKAVDTFRELGVSQDAIKRGNLTQVLRDAADGLRAVDSPARRAADAQQLLGRSAKALGPLFEQGAHGIDDALAAAQRYGAYLPANTTQFEKARDAQRNLNLAMDGMKISFTQAVLPSLVQVGGKLVAFIGQMRSGQGAGGDFARVISQAFRTVKTVVSTVVGVLGGLGNTVRLVTEAFLAYKIAQFTRELKILFTTVRASPLGIFLTVLGLLAAAYQVVSSRQISTAESARRVRDAWNQAREAAHALNDAHLQVAQSQLDVKRSAQALAQAQAQVTQAADKYGRKSGQYHQAQENLVQATIDHRQALNGLADAQDAVRHATDRSNQSSRNAVSTARAQVGQDRARIDTLKRAAAASAIANAALHRAGQETRTTRQQTEQLSRAEQKLKHDQDQLNRALNAMPRSILTTVRIDFRNKLRGLPISVRGYGIPGHARGGMVNTPGYFAGEEAPGHPEVVLSTNRAYHARNVGLWAQAGRLLGIPGFAKGGVFTPVSQSTPNQIQQQKLANQLTLAQNAGNAAAQARVSDKQSRLLTRLIAADQAQLRHTRSRQNVLTLLQEIGSLEASLGTARSALTADTTTPGSFDLAPTGAAVRLPTGFDVIRAIRTTAAAGATHHHHGNVTVNVTKDGDERKVIQAIDKTLGSHVHARMRAAGMRGT